MPAPLLVVISGLPASGKSWLGSRLAPALRLPYVTKDEYKELLHRRHEARVAEGLHPHIHKAGLWGGTVPPQACVVPLDLGAPLLRRDTSGGADDVARVADWVRGQEHAAEAVSSGER